MNTHRANLSQPDGRMITHQGTFVHETPGTDHSTAIGAVCPFPYLKGYYVPERYYSSHIHGIHSAGSTVPTSGLASELSDASKRNDDLDSHDSDVITDGAEENAGSGPAISYPNPVSNASDTLSSVNNVVRQHPGIPPRQSAQTRVKTGTKRVRKQKAVESARRTRSRLPLNAANMDSAEPGSFSDNQGLSLYCPRLP